MSAFERLPKSAQRVLAIIATLAIGLAGGALARALNFPLPWLLGALVAVAALGLSGAPTRAIPGSRSAGQVVVGAAAGLQFTGAIFAKLGQLLPLIIGVALISTLIGILGALILMRLTGLDRATAFFATVPGGIVETITVAARRGVPLEPVMVGQTMRIGIIVVLAPFLVRHFADTGVMNAIGSIPIVTWPLLLALLAAGTLAGALLAWINAPSPWLLGPLFVAALGAAFGFAGGRPPDLLLVVAQIVMGTALGAQFRHEFVTRLWRYLLGSTIAVMVAAGMTAAFAVSLAHLLGYPVATLVLATAPAGIAEMTLTGKLLGLDATLIAGFQLVRIVVVLIWCRTALRVFERLMPK
jgi:membrane AbrB-like protein